MILVPSSGLFGVFTDGSETGTLAPGYMVHVLSSQNWPYKRKDHITEHTLKGSQGNQTCTWKVVGWHISHNKAVPSAHTPLSSYLEAKMGKNVRYRQYFNQFYYVLGLNIPRNLTKYPEIWPYIRKIFTIKKSGPTKNWPNTRKDLISEDHITGSQCTRHVYHKIGLAWFLGHLGWNFSFLASEVKFRPISITGTL